MKKLLITLICCLTTACLNVKQAERQQYALTLSKPHIYKTIHKTIEVAPISINSQFSGASFVYRVGEHEYKTDFYNIFMNAPAEQIHQTLENYIAESHVFRHVTTPYDDITPSVVLNGHIDELYADYRDRNHPKAIIAMRVTLQKHKKVIWEKQYREAIPLTEKTSTDLVREWNIGLSRIAQAVLRRLV